jgi:hypothetical protein
MQSVPIVRLEVEYMKESILHAFSHHQIEMDSMVRAAVEKACEPKALQHVIDTTVRQVIDGAVKQEIQNFFSHYGNGGKAIRAAVTECLDLVYPDKEQGS